MLACACVCLVASWKVDNYSVEAAQHKTSAKIVWLSVWPLAVRVFRTASKLIHCVCARGRKSLVLFILLLSLVLAKKATDAFLLLFVARMMWAKCIIAELDSGNAFARNFATVDNVRFLLSFLVCKSIWWILTRLCLLSVLLLPLLLHLFHFIVARLCCGRGGEPFYECVLRQRYNTNR